VPDATAAADAATPRAGAGIFTDRSYRRLWGIGAINSVMRWVEMVAVGVYVFQLTGSPWALALTGFFRALPMLTFGVFIGAIADRVDRRRMLLVLLAVVTVVYGALGVLVVTGHIELWHVLLGAFIVGILWAADFPVRRNMVTDVVGRPKIATAIGIDQATMNISRIVGPTLAGVFVEWIGVQAAYFAGTGLYFIAALLALGVTWKRPLAAASSVSPLANIAEGIRYVRSNDIILPTLLITILVNVFVFPYSFVMPAVAQDVLGAGPLLLGVLTSVEGLGATLGSVLIATRARPAHYTRVYFFGACLFALMVIAFAATPWYLLALPVVFLGGLGMSGFGAMQSIIILNSAPADMRGRVLGVLTVCIGSSPLGALQIGWLSAQFSPSLGIAVIGSAGLVTTLLTALVWPRFTRTREVEPQPARRRAVRADDSAAAV
jgi:MFS family permease